MNANQLRALRIAAAFPAGVNVAMLTAGLGLTDRTTKGIVKKLLAAGHLADDGGRLTVTAEGAAAAWE